MQADGSYKPAQSKTDWGRLEAMTDEEIANNISSDSDATPLLTKEWFERAELYNQPQKAMVSLRLDKRVVEWFKYQGKGYQSRMNNVLKAYVDTHPR
ncbi:MAG: 3-oxoacyl-ACP synthase [Alphaproteobacteria bacterium]|nr:MAG: 3-oxoacyl-ACP synthase [Alphaproteobacteria bacterium]